MFCYTGGFAVAAAAFGAGHVTAVDVKEDWLALGRKNADLNGAGDKIDFLKADCFSLLEKLASGEEKYDIVILDPPSFLRTRDSLKTAILGYRKLNAAAMACLGENGILCTFSCSHNMSNNCFSNTIKEAAVKAGKKLTILKRCHQAPDHPIVKSIPETEYLKGYFFRVSTG